MRVGDAAEQGLDEAMHGETAYPGAMTGGVAPVM